MRPIQGEFLEARPYLKKMHAVKPQASDRPQLRAPEGLRRSALRVGNLEYLVLSYPLAGWTLPATLTQAEGEVVSQILAGKSRREVALARGSSERTVSNLLAQVFRKLGVNSRVELARRLRADAPPRTRCSPEEP